MTKEKKIIRRIEDAKENLEIKQSMYRFRKFLAGDHAAIGADKVAVTPTAAGKIYRSNPNFPDFRISSHEEGVSNSALTWVMTLIKQSFIQKPSIVFPNVSEKEVSQVLEQYILDRLEKSFWERHQFTMLMSRITDGIAFAKITMRKGMPCLRYKDTLDMYWDLHSESPEDYRFLACEVRANEDTIRNHFGEDAYKKIKKNVTGQDDASPDDDDGERIFKFIEYWDDDTQCYLTCGNAEIIPGTRRENELGFIPFEILAGERLPSMWQPLSHLVHTVGPSTAKANLQRSLFEMDKRQKPVIVGDPSAFDQESWEAFREAPDTIPVLETVGARPANEALSLVALDKINPQTLQREQALTNDEIQAIGVNPYAGGVSQDVQFARQVDEIRSQSGLNATILSAELSRFMARAIPKLLKMGILYDSQPFEAVYGDDPIIFNTLIPIDPVLAAGAESAVEVTSGHYESQQERIAKAQALLTQAIALRAEFPQLLTEAMQRFLAAFDVRGIEALTAPPDEVAQFAQMPPEVRQAVLQYGVAALQQVQSQGAGAEMAGVPS